MYRVLMQGLRLRVETYDLEERLVAQMLFTGNTAKLDRVFELYASRKKTGENIVRAYFTVKSVEYFLENRPTDDKVFAFWRVLCREARIGSGSRIFICWR